MTSRSILIFLLLLLISFSCSKECIEGDGKLIRVQQELNEFDKIFNSSTIDINITKGDSFLATLQGDSNIVANIDLKVGGGELEIDPGNFCGTTQQLKLDLVVPMLREIKNEGTGNIKGNTLYENLNIENSGTGNIELIGQSVQEMNIRNNGTGAILMFGLGAERLTISNSGTGDAFVFVSQDLDVTISGTGNVYYRGQPTIKSDISGIGQLIDDN